MDLIDVMTLFNTNEKCYKHLEEYRWPDGPVCPHCSGMKTTKRKDNRHLCRSCNVAFSVLHSTVMESTRLPLSKWFMAIALIMNAKKGLSSLQLARDLKVNRKTGWYMQLRIRKMMKENHDPLLGVIEADETFIGGSLMNQHYYKKQKIPDINKTGYNHKSTIMGLLQRRGKIVLVHLDKGASKKEIGPIFKELVNPRSKIVTDGYGGYHGLSEHFKKHYVLNTAKYVRGFGRYNTNSIEGFWALVKRAVIGQYHKISPKYLMSYLDEITFKRNNKDQGDLFDSWMKRAFPAVCVT